MLEGQVIGDYGSEQEQAEARSKDERDDWSKIPVASLHAYQSSLSFFDAKGTRFHVPAFLMAETNGERLEMDTGLTMAAYMTDKFALLNDEQRAAVHAFLLSMQPHEEYAFSSDEIGRPLQAIGPRNWLSFDLPEQIHASAQKERCALHPYCASPWEGRGPIRAPFYCEEQIQTGR